MTTSQGLAWGAAVLGGAAVVSGLVVYRARAQLRTLGGDLAAAEAQQQQLLTTVQAKLDSVSTYVQTHPDPGPLGTIMQIVGAAGPLISGILQAI